MPTDGSGNYSLPDGSVAVNGDVIQASVHNTPLNDIAAGLSARVMANGFKAMTANLQMGGNKVIGLPPAAANPGEAVPYEQYNAAPTETTSGIVELATEVEAQAGADNVRYMTPLRVLQGIQILYATAANIFTGAANKIVSASGLVSAGAYVPADFNATLTLDCDAGLRRSFTVTDDFTLNLTNGKPGHTYVVKITQGAGAPHVITYGANISFGDVDEIVLSNSEGDADLLFFYCDAASAFVSTGARKGI